MNLETSPIPENEQTMELGKKYENAIRNFLKEHVQREQESKQGKSTRVPWESHEFDISAPRSKDLESIAKDNYEIKNIKISPRSTKEKKNFHFYIGQTEFHIMGKAADRLLEIYDQENK